MDKAYDRYKKTFRRSKSTKKVSKKTKEISQRNKSEVRIESEEESKARNDWDAPLVFDNKNQKKSKKPKIVKQETQKPETTQEAKTSNVTEKKSLAEIYEEIRKKRKIKHIELSEDIDEKFAQLPKRLRTRITKKQLNYVMNHTTMGDIISHLITNEKQGIVKAPKQKSHHYVPGQNMAEQVTDLL